MILTPNCLSRSPSVVRSVPWNQRGGILDTFAVLAELQRTWNRPDAMDFAAVFAEHVIPGYRALVECYDKAQSVERTGRETKLDRLEAASAKK